MTDDHRMTWGFIFDVLDVLDRHGYRRSDNQHTKEAVVLIWDLAHVYEGTMDAPCGADVAVLIVPAHPSAAASPGRAGRGCLDRHRRRHRRRRTWMNFSPEENTLALQIREAAT